MKKKHVNTSLRKIQLSELELLKKIDKFCKKNDINYYLIGGTLLGAVRHKGFIPWDDDVDIVLMRKDFERFCELVYKEKNIKLKSYKNDDDYKHYIPIVYDENVDIINSSFVNEKIMHPWVDLFPLDNVPNNFMKRKIYVAKIMCLRALISLSAFDDIVKINKKNRPFYERIIIFLGKKFKFYKLLNTKKLFNAVDKRLKKYNKKETKFIACLMGEYKTKEVIPKSFYNEVALYEFEKSMFPATKDYDGMLKHFFGDYMKLPEESERYGKHNVDLVKEDRNGKN